MRAINGAELDLSGREWHALGIVAVADAFWVKQSLTLTPAELASLAVWLQLPWTAKMVVSEFVDALPILGSQRRSYTLIGAGLIAGGLVLLAGAAGGWIGFAAPERIYAADFAVINKKLPEWDEWYKKEIQAR